MEGVYKARVENKIKLFKNKKHLQAWIMERLEKAIDNIDPLKLLVVCGTAFFIKTSIEWTEEIVSRATAKNLYSTLITTAFFGPITGAINLMLSKPNEEVQKALDSPAVELLEWLLSFVIAYIIVEHAGEILQAGGDILFTARALIGAVGAGG